MEDTLRKDEVIVMWLKVGVYKHKKKSLSLTNRDYFPHCATDISKSLWITIKFIYLIMKCLFVGYVN